MERLTERLNDEFYGVWVKDHDYITASRRLADYEDTGLTPIEIKGMIKSIYGNADLQWIHGFDDGCWNKWTCPCCGYMKRTDTHVSLGWNYCPICGAKLLGGNGRND